MSTPQHMQALAVANATRRRRSELLIEVAELDTEDGRGLLADMLDGGYAEHPDVAQALSNVVAVNVLHWVRRMPRPVAVRYVKAIGASETRLVGSLSVRQREVLAGLLRGGVEALKLAEEENEFERWRRLHGTAA